MWCGAVCSSGPGMLIMACTARRHEGTLKEGCNPDRREKKTRQDQENTETSVAKEKERGRNVLVQLVGFRLGTLLRTPISLCPGPVCAPGTLDFP